MPDELPPGRAVLQLQRPMFAIRRPKRQSLEPTDFRKVSALVHERRSERARNSETLRENPEAAEAAVRTYRPQEDLRSVDRKTQQFVVDAADIPRTWDRDSDTSNASPRVEVSVRRDYLTMLGINVVLATITLHQLTTGGLTDLLLFPCLAAASAIIVVVASIRYFQKLRQLAWAGLVTCVLELAAFLLVLEWFW